LSDQAEQWVPFCETLGYEFTDFDLLHRAFIHESLVNESLDSDLSNERLEFLGDSVLGLAVAEFLFKEFPEEPEGQLAQMKSYLVSRKHLAVCADRWKLGQYLQLGKGEENSGGKRRESLLANCFEAVVGAVFLDGGYTKARRAIVGVLGDDMRGGLGAVKDEKSRLQEKVQTVFQALPEYRIIEEKGPAHDRTFEVEVLFGGEVLGQGTGRSKREASQAAAKVALKKFYQRGENWYEPYLGSLPRSGVQQIKEDF
jgi:ribonuclease III